MAEDRGGVAMRRREREGRVRTAREEEAPPLVPDSELMKTLSAPFTAYLAPPGFANELQQELGEISAIHGRLVLASGPPRVAHWAQNVWQKPQILTVSSIKDAVRQLRSIQRNWYCYSVHLHRRSALVTEQLPHVSAKTLTFPSALPSAPLGSWTFLDKETVLASPTCSSPFAHGEARFVEDHENPPSRAYLKLWEALTLFGQCPAPAERCLDLGSSPGGWTWVLGQLGCAVISVDKAPLDPRVARLPNVEFLQESAFGLEPTNLPDIDWLFSDIICYPKRLHDLICRWIQNPRMKHVIATIKFQSDTDFEATSRLAQIPGARLIHLHHNKHELTFFWTRPEGASSRTLPA
jgi:23S rRNA (cytidine2498-2'-O)-methyltransferase